METTDRRLWMRRALVTAAAVATLPFLSLPEVPSTQLPPVLDLFNRAWAPLALAALLSFVAFSLVLIWSRAERGARDLAVFLAGAALTLSVWMSLAVDNPDALEEMLESLSAPVSVTFAVWTLSCAALMRFSVTFPRQATLDDFHRAFWFGNKPLVETPPTFTRWVWWLFKNAWPVGMGVSAFLGFASVIGGELMIGTALMLMWAFTNFPLMAALALFPRIHRKGDERTRRQTYWMALGVTWGLIILPIVGLYATLLPAMIFPGAGTNGWMQAGGVTVTGLALGALIFVGCVVIALFKDGLFDPRLALGRSIVYGGVGFLLLFLFAVLEEVLQSLVLDRIGVGSNLSGWIAGGGAAMAFGPLRFRMENFMAGWIGETTPGGP